MFGDQTESVLVIREWCRTGDQFFRRPGGNPRLRGDSYRHFREAWKKRVSLARSATIRFLDGLRDIDSAEIYRFDSKVVLVQKFSNSRDVTDKVFRFES
jgi:hypothetical protein